MKGFDFTQGAGQAIIVLIFDIIVYTALLLYFEAQEAKKAASHYVPEGGAPPAPVADEIPEGEDDDVHRERMRVHTGESEQMDPPDRIILKHVQKWYPPVAGSKPYQAVRDMCFGVHEGECFGLLGVNGAGKTTTMAMMSGEFPMSNGQAILAGYDVATELDQVLGQLGFCPQFDALLDKLTARECLRLYAAIKGIPEDKTEAVVQDLIDRVGLPMHADRATGGYSGGNKRKCSMAIALMGSPRLVFLVNKVGVNKR